MKFSRLAHIAFIAALALSAQQALALSEDDKSMSTPSGAPRFSDPDDQTPSAINLTGKTARGGVDPSTVRYDYDPSTSSYVPHKN